MSPTPTPKHRQRLSKNPQKNSGNKLSVSHFDKSEEKLTKLDPLLGTNTKDDRSRKMHTEHFESRKADKTNPPGGDHNQPFCK